MARILVVEDDLDIADLIGQYLTAAGHTVERLTSGREVLARLRREPVDLVILDIMLPELDGLRVCGAMRAEPATAAIPIIMLTARGEEADRISGLERGRGRLRHQAVQPEGADRARRRTAPPHRTAGHRRSSATATSRSTPTATRC